MNQLQILVEVAIAIMSIGVGWGILKSKVASIDKDLSRIESKITSIENGYVTYQHFNQVISAMRDDYKELKADVKEIIRLVSERT